MYVRICIHAHTHRTTFITDNYDTFLNSSPSEKNGKISNLFLMLIEVIQLNFVSTGLLFYNFYHIFYNNVVFKHSCLPQSNIHGLCCVQFWTQYDNFKNKAEMICIAAPITTPGRYACQCPFISPSLSGRHFQLIFNKAVTVIYSVRSNVTVVAQKNVTRKALKKTGGHRNSSINNELRIELRTNLMCQQIQEPLCDSLHL